MFQTAGFLPGTRLDSGQDFDEAGKQLHDMSHRTLTNRRAKSTGVLSGLHVSEEPEKMAERIYGEEADSKS
jgi:hypothetical protein